MSAPILPAPRIRTFCILTPCARGRGRPGAVGNAGLDCFEGRDSDETEAGRHIRFFCSAKISRYDPADERRPAAPGMVPDELDGASRPAAAELPGSGRARRAPWRRSAACRRSSCPGKSSRSRSRSPRPSAASGSCCRAGIAPRSFADCDSGQIARKLKILLQMSLVLLHGLKKPVVRIGRFAGQYAKPRSADTETRDGVTLPSYRGDLVNRPGFTAAEREPDPELLLRGYERAALTLNFVRALIDGGFADLHHPEYWDLGFVKHSPWRDQYQQIASSIADALDFFEAMSGSRVHEASRAPFYASHEALHLHYEQAQTRFIARQGRWYNLSTHLPWIGMRTADLGGAPRRILPRHLQSDRGEDRPVDGCGVGAGPVSRAEPANEPGRLVLIHRMGAQQCREQAAAADRGGAGDRRAGAVDLRSDARQHRKHESRRQDAPVRKYRQRTRGGIPRPQGHGQIPRRRAFRVDGRRRHRVHRWRAGPGRCGPRARLRSQVDPRLNYEQALELAMRIASNARST